MHIGVTRKASDRWVGRKGGPAPGSSEKTRSGPQEFLIAVAPEDMHLAGGRKVRTDVKAIGIKHVASRAGEVVIQGAAAGKVRQRNLRQQCRRLRSQTA